MFRKILISIGLTLLIVSAAAAQTGKISGKIVDKQTNEPLIGANIIVVGTNFGTASDADGNYIIQQVPVGEYSIKASYIGYQDVTMQGIRIVAGLTQEVNFSLNSSSVATGEVVILSERPIIEKSATNAVRIVDAEDSITASS